MAWICTECSNRNSYRHRVCTQCHTPMSSGEIRRVVAEEIRLQRAKLGKHLVGLGRSMDRVMDMAVQKRRRLNIVAGSVLVVLMAASILMMQGGEYAQAQREALECAAEKAHILAEDFGAAARWKQDELKGQWELRLMQPLRELGTEKGAAAVGNFQEAWEEKRADVRPIQMKPVDFSKVRLLEEKLWEAICKIQSWF